jgi:ubiquinone/menaquinone biosynthesis C-methylase UbiE
LNAVGCQWDAGLVGSSRSADVYADFLLQHLTTDTLLVDVGCGSGELALDLAGKVRRLMGVDSDHAEVDAARRSAETLGVRNADFCVGDLYALALRDGQADVVFGHSVLEALERPGDALKEMTRVLKPGGLLAVASVEYRSP